MALTDNLQAFYKLSDTSDSSGNNRTLTNNGDVSFASGKIGNAAVFDGDFSKYLDIPNGNQVLQGATGFSFSAWFNKSADVAWQRLFGFSSNSGPMALFCTTDSQAGSNSIEFGFYDILNGNGVNTTISEFSPSVGQWYHVVGTISSDKIKLYVDGQQISESDKTFNFSESYDTYFVGSQYQDTPFNGQVDAVGIWNRALSGAEVAELYNNGTGLELDGVAQPTLVKMQAPVKFFGKVKFGV